MAIGIQDNNQGRDPFDDFLDTLNQEREVIDVPEVSTDPEPVTADEGTAEDNVPDPVIERAKFDAAMIPAETVVDCIDVGFTSLNTFIAKEDQEGATESEKESLTKATANWLKDTDIDLSPGKMLIFLVLMIYGPKTIQAFQTRKQNKENEELAAENERLRNMIEKQQDKKMESEKGKEEK